MAEDAVRLFEEYAVRVAQGERPDVCALLERAGPERADLARLLDRFLATRPASEPDPDTLAAFKGLVEGRSPLHELRLRRGLKVDDVVFALLAALELDVAKKQKLAAYYHELEHGLLDRSRVSARVFDALMEILRTERRELLGWPGRLLTTQPAYYRNVPAGARGCNGDAPVVEHPPAGLRAPPQADAGEWDEVDELFCGSR